MGSRDGSFDTYSQAIELSIRIVELTEKNRDLILAREGIFNKYEYSRKAREMATVITNEVGKKWGVIDRIIELSQNEPISKSSSLLRAVLRVGTQEVYFNRKKVGYFIKASLPFLSKKASRALVNRASYVLRKVYKFKGERPKSFYDFCFWYLFFPEWISRKLEEEFGRDRALKIMEEMNKLPTMTVRVNTLQTDVESVLTSFRKNYNYNCTISQNYPFIKLDRIYPVMRTEEYKKGIVTVQDEVTALGVLRLVEIGKEFGLVLDACAAPGRKASLFIQLVPECNLVALDISFFRLKKMISDFKRQRLPEINIVLGDAARLPFGNYVFDAVIADLPCSGSGTWGKHPERRWLTTPDRYKECVIIQKNILSAIKDVVRKGGFLLYSTCSLWKEENEDIINWFLNTFEEFDLVEERRFFPERASTGFFYAICRRK